MTDASKAAAVRHTEIGRLLAAAEAAIAARDWPAAAAMLTSVLGYEPSHAEAAARLAFVRGHAVHPAERVRGTAHDELHLSRAAVAALAIAGVLCAGAAVAMGVWAGS